ncbi:DUF5675 family protein [Capnocytophaga canis]|uniref:DUF5675 family protein n=1 Tax=Capnocytophaga canis TaxID=1848903 RepID=UPI001562E5B6|nr:DUF5675 family protein [Capnocytophaga canis]
MKRIILTRKVQNLNHTLSTLHVEDEQGNILFSCVALERGWQNNKRNVSCVPAGVYRCVFEFSPKFNRKLWELKGVPNRSECKFHPANYWHQLEGCIALGYAYKPNAFDDYGTLMHSSNAINDFHRILKNDLVCNLYVFTASHLNNSI